ncbi:ATP-binding protein [Arcticibacterium luteifluviistationis]|uniref:histidine kinase n=1 Tax=Arcticibacterium luteifluviistationis TaxID=1784714 RepID=A0A2Z4GAN5_9BACT|nr:ATP-binding protein [Arcticibacterium luteifluviistationis]AWV98204.1 hypothetical protein DJ013_08465 [Arcticibacterium luteifluviistationis]
MSGLFKKSILSVILLLLGAHLSAQPILLSENIKYNESISSHVMFFEDTTGEMDIAEVVKAGFTENQGRNNFIIPFSDHAFWFKVDFEKETDTSDDWVIWFTNELIENLEFYEYDSLTSSYILADSWNVLTSRNKFFKGQEPFFDFKLRDKTTLYFKLKSERALVLTMRVSPSDLKAKISMSNFGRITFVNGLLIFRLLLVLTLGLFVINDIGFRAYSVLVLIKSLGYWGLINAITPAIITNPISAQKLNFLLYTSSPIGTVIFSLAVLPFFELPSWFKKVLYLFAFLTVGVNVLVQFDYSWQYLRMGVGVSVLSGLFIVFIFGYSVLKKLPIQKYYAIPFLLGLISYLLMNMRILFQVQIPLASTIAFFLFAAEIFIFIFFLGRIFKETQLKHFMATEKLKNEEIQSVKLLELDNLKTSFFTNISHELKTPLTLISGPVEELRKKYPEEKLLGMIGPNLGRLKQLINQILDIQKIEAGKQELNIVKKDLAKHLRMQVFAFHSLAEAKELSLNFTQNKNEFLAYFDEDKLNKIIDNLLSNAIKYTAAHGDVKVKVVFHKEPHKLQISVEDTGYGISEKDLPFIFDRFYQVDNDNYQGSGVGLALVKELVTLLKGTIDVSSQLNKGTSFLVSLPVDKKTWNGFNIETKEELDSFENSTVPLERDSEKDLILLVEDNEDMQFYLKTIFEDEYEIIQAFNGLEGIEKANQEVPDIIICDLMMPLMDGFEFSKKIRGQVTSSHVPIIMLTAKSSKESRMESFDIGIDQYMTKPFDADELRGVVKNKIENRKKLRTYFSEGERDIDDSGLSVSPLERVFIDTLNDFLEHNYSNSTLSVMDMAERMEMSDTQLRRKLKNISGYSPNEYLRKFRLKKAEQLLKRGNKSISEIAFEIGFENLSYFSKIFQQEYDCLPSEYVS